MVTIALFGAAPDTPNLGVSALLFSAVSGISKYIPSVRFIVFDYGYGIRRAEPSFSDARSVDIVLCGLRAGYRYYRSENLLTISVLAKLGALGAYINPIIRLIDSCDVVLDLSGGDSFSDIYGQRRFINTVRRKLIAINRCVPLILLPQTYGPFIDSTSRSIALKAVAGADMAFARDDHSFANLKDLLGECFDAERHRVGVDMAFGLQSRNAVNTVDGRIRTWIERERVNGSLVGFNVSGLLFNNFEKAKIQYGLLADYRLVVSSFLFWLLNKTNACVVLVPHVVSAPDHYESDVGASQGVLKEMPSRFLDRITISPSKLDQSQVKWLISKFDWFCGARMHATIAALSSGVPTAGIAYSDKMKGVFESCYQGGQVVDPRKTDTEQVVARLKELYADREMEGRRLRKRLPVVRELADRQLKAVSDRIVASRDRSR